MELADTRKKYYQHDMGLFLSSKVTLHYFKIGMDIGIATTPGNIYENVSIMQILSKIVTFVKFSGENSERVINKKNLIANALWEMI